jgi:hypothetical protein
MNSLACGLIQQAFIYAPDEGINLLLAMTNWGQLDIGPEDTENIIYTLMIRLYETEPGTDGAFVRIPSMSKVFWKWFKNCTGGREWV